MSSSNEYGGLDYFRIIAAALVVAIHTSPLSIINDRADFIFTRILCRIAVPFFFMVSGFFLYADNRRMKNKVNRFARKTANLYGIAILLYLPINIYNGYFKTKPLLANILQDILFDGTIYHLWYLPAAIIGAYITLLLFYTGKDKLALFFSFALYLIGLFGDSYYGISARFGPLKNFYDFIFRCFDYTRNGIFFAPIFLLIGGLIARNKNRYSLYFLVNGLIISFCLMLTEGVILNFFSLQRHDSMYLMLLPCMFILFEIILHCNKKPKPMFRTISTIVYIIHPFIIVLLRGMAKFLKIQDFLIYNSLIYYLAVLGISLAFAVICTIPTSKPLRVDTPTQERIGNGRAWLQIDLRALEHNVKVLRSIAPKDCNIMAIVKANAYGHGDYKIASHLNSLGINAFGVATIDEGISLRKHGIKGEILILGYTDPMRINELIEYQLMQTVIDYNYAKMLNYSKTPIQVHLKIDTGMHRIGLNVNDVEKINEIFSFPMLDIQGIFTHLSVADSLSREDVIYTKRQIKNFFELIYTLKGRGIVIPKIHFQSSYGLLNYPDLCGDYVRIGIALYGTLSSPKDKTRVEVDLHPVLSLKARIAMIHSIAQGEQVGYGRKFIAKRDTLLAVLPIGYADGLPRNLSCENGKVLIHGHYAPIIGRICMDQMLVDITDIPKVKAGDIATLIGKDGDNEITAADVAFNSGTITNELLSRIGTRLDRIYC